MSLKTVFQIPLPTRGHAAAAHPLRPEAVAFARRPGTFAVVIDCVAGQAKARLSAPEGRHFYGHGTFSKNGDWLFMTENDFEVGRGSISIWDANRGYKRAGEFDSGGIGPHDIKRLHGSDTLVVANGGIDTHPDTGRTKLNIATMQSNLAYIDDGIVVEEVVLPSAMQKNSIRHLAVNKTGAVAFGMQWQGDNPVDGLVGLHRRGAAPEMMQTTADQIRSLKDYIGSIAFASDGLTIAATSPRGGILHLYDANRMTLGEVLKIEDVCGAASRLDGFVFTSGTGGIGTFDGRRTNVGTPQGNLWDNHLIAM
jgi:hypothetical protein